jgi:hypothetical protein
VDPSEPHPLATAVGAQDGLLLKGVLVLSTDRFDLAVIILSLADRVEEDQQPGLLLLDDPLGIEELP